MYKRGIEGKRDKDVNLLPFPTPCTTTKCIFSDEKIRHEKSSFLSLRTFSDEIGLLVTKLISSLKVLVTKNFITKSPI